MKDFRTPYAKLSEEITDAFHAEAAKLSEEKVFIPQEDLENDNIDDNATVVEIYNNFVQEIFRVYVVKILPNGHFIAVDTIDLEEFTFNFNDLSTIKDAITLYELLAS